MRERSRGLLGLIVLGASLALAGVPAAPARAVDAQATATATFAGGCFWCMQPPFEALPGVVSTTVGYTGGTTKNPTYEEVSAGGTGHAESVQIAYDPQKISYEKLLDVFWHNVDPLTPTRSSVTTAASTARRSSRTTTRSGASPRSRSSASRSRSASSSRSSRRSSRPARSTRPRSTTRSTTRRIPRGTSTIAGAAGAISVSRRSGARSGGTAGHE